MNESIMTPEEFKEYLEQLSRKDFEDAENQPQVKACLQKGSPYTEIWNEQKLVQEAFISFDVPKPSRNIAASVMASIATEEASNSSKQQNSFGAKVVELFNWKFQVPAWGVAAVLLVLIGSVALHFSGEESNKPAPIQSAGVDQPTLPSPTPDQPQVIYVNPQNPESIVPVSRNSNLPIGASTMPSLVIIMGAPTNSWIPEHHTFNRQSFDIKDEEI